MTDTMHASADISTAGAMAPAVAPSLGDRPVDTAPPTIRNATVIVYIAAACMCLSPGLLGAAGVVLPADTPAGAAYQRLLHALDDIRFGEGLRFWLGATGAAMMGLLLLYPLRKAFARGRQLGSVRGWFHAHILMGLFGPVLVLYHANFGHGALNANVALWSMLVVVVSGLLGHFVYMRVSAHFWGDKRKARALLDDAVAGLRGLDAQAAATQALIQKLEACETHMLAPRRGLVASVAARLRASLYRRQFHRQLSALISACAKEQRWSAEHGRQRSRNLHGLLKQYLDSVRSATGRSVLEQIWARWRLFHLPVFLIMIVAAALHVIAVWGMDAGPRDGAPVEFTQAPASGAIMAAPRVPDPIANVLAAGEAKTGSAAVTTQMTASATNEQASAKARPEKLAVPKPALPATPPAASKPLPEPPIASRPSTVDDVLARLVDLPRQVAAPPKATGEPQARVDEAATRMVAAPKRPLTKPAPPKVDVPQATTLSVQPSADPIEATYAELQQRMAQPAATRPPPMGLGATTGSSKPVPTLSERIAELKAKKFDHGTTRFPLTGKHTKVDCADCHTTTLENTPRTCVACHKADDPHRGRRPDCARCHTTNRWTQILRR